MGVCGSEECQRPLKKNLYQRLEGEYTIASKKSTRGPEPINKQEPVKEPAHVADEPVKEDAQEEPVVKEEDVNQHPNKEITDIRKRKANMNPGLPKSILKKSPRVPAKAPVREQSPVAVNKKQSVPKKQSVHKKKSVPKNKKQSVPKKVVKKSTKKKSAKK